MYLQGYVLIGKLLDCALIKICVVIRLNTFVHLYCHSSLDFLQLI